MPLAVPLVALWLRAGLVGPVWGGAGGDALVHCKALWGALARDGGGCRRSGGAVCVLVVSNSRALFLRSPSPDEWRGGETAASVAAVVTPDTLLSPLQQTGYSFPSLSLFVVCLMC